jgi:signal peptidase II
VNPGALFGLRLGVADDSVWLANTVFAVVSILAAIAITYWSLCPSTGRDRFLCAALGLILGGTLGNLYDRLVFHGVRDFLHFYWFEFPVFNIADSCLVCGAFLLLVQAFVSHPAKPDREPAGEAVISGAASAAK